MKTWEELKNDEPGTVYYDEIHSEVRLLIMRGPHSINAYIGIPEDHPAAGMDYDKINVPVHGGWTFASWGSNKTHYPAGWYWFGWDYAHYGDAALHDSIFGSEGIQWTPDMVRHDALEAMGDIRRFFGFLVADESSDNS